MVALVSNSNEHRQQVLVFDHQLTACLKKPNKRRLLMSYLLYYFELMCIISFT